MTMPTLQQRRGTTAALQTVNPTPLAGEIVWASDTNTLRVGDGVTAYSSLSVISAAPTDGSVTTAKLANDAVTYAKLQNVSATDRLLGRSSVGAGDVEEITCTAFGRSLIDDADAASARTTLSVQPTASPAFTGAATVTNDGNVVPLTVTNTGTANSFVVNDESGDTTPFVVDAAGKVGVGTSAPSVLLHVAGTSTGTVAAQVQNSSSGANAQARSEYVATGSTFLVGATNAVSLGSGGFLYTTAGPIVFFVETTERLRLGTTAATLTVPLLVTAGSGSAGSYKPGIAVSGDDDTGVQQVGGANTISLVTAGNERLRVTDSRVFINGNGEQYGFGVRYVSTGGAVHFGATSNSATPDAAISNAGGGTLLLAKNDGEVIVGGTTDQGAYNLQCNGTGVWGAGAYVNGSDKRIKDEIAPIGEATSVIAAMQPVTFRYKPTWSSDRSIQPGFVAQQLQEALAGTPYLDGVVQQGTEYLSVAYQSLIPLLVKALQESNARIAALEERLNHA